MAILIGGTIGSFIGIKKERPFWEQSLSILSGALIANYTAPVIIDLLGLTEASTAGVGFIVGYLGKQGLEMIIDKLKKKIKSN